VGTATKEIGLDKQKKRKGGCKQRRASAQIGKGLLGKKKKKKNCWAQFARFKHCRNERSVHPRNKTTGKGVWISQVCYLLTEKETHFYSGNKRRLKKEG